MTSYKTLILPHFAYIEIVYDCLSVKNNNILRLQNMCSKNMLKQDRRRPTVEVHKMANMLTLKQHRYKYTAQEMYKVITGLAPSYICNTLKRRSEVHSRITGSNRDPSLYPPKFRLECTNVDSDKGDTQCENPYQRIYRNLQA